MHETHISPTLIDEWLRHPRWPRSYTIAAIGLTLMLLLLSAAYLDGVLATSVDGVDGGFWRLTLASPALILYALSAYHFLLRLIVGATEAFRPLVVASDGAFDRLVAQASILNRRREWVAVAIGAPVGLLFFRLWNGPETAFWLKLYWLFSGVLVGGLGGWSIYASLAYTRLITELTRQPLDFDIFNPQPLEPVSRLGLGVSLNFIFAITLVILFVPDPRVFLRLEWIIWFGLLMLAAVLAFFLTLMSTHDIMVAAKERELERARNNLSTAYQKLKDLTGKDDLQELEALSYTASTWAIYEKRIEEAPEWPHSTGTIRSLVASTLLPVAAWIAQVIVELVT